MTNFLEEVIKFQLVKYSVKIHNLKREIQSIKNLSDALDRNIEIYKKICEEKQISNNDKECL